jgi:hypothetical protein
MDWLINQACTKADIQPVIPGSPAGVEVVRRTDGIQTWLFALNYSKEEVTIPLEQPGYEVLSETSLDKSLHLGAGDVGIVQLANE